LLTETSVIKLADDACLSHFAADDGDGGGGFVSLSNCR
jgi:hypothetical protein